MQLKRFFLALSFFLCTAFLAPSRSLAQGDAPSPPPPAPPATQPTSTQVETVVFFRHAEKPATDLGQLTPQGLNRALALSVVLPRKFGKPDFLFAPDPAQQVTKNGHAYYYIRPLATLEPTAICLGMPVQTPCGFREIDKLNDELSQPQYAHAMIFVAWEHIFAQKAAAALFARFGGDATKVPFWPPRDYDSLYVITIRHGAGNAVSATFDHQQEGLDGQSKTMPAPSPN